MDSNDTERMDSNDTERMVQSRRLLEQMAVSKDGKWRMDVLAAQLNSQDAEIKGSVDQLAESQNLKF